MLPLVNVLIFIWLGISSVGVAVSGYGCDKLRTVQNSPSGIITDGSGNGKNYTANTHCEWLIVGNESHRYVEGFLCFVYRWKRNISTQIAFSFISLSFTSLNTECAFDYIFVYDGGGAMLGSFSGDGGIPESPLVSSTGSMRVLFYSDTNYVLGGFTAEYSISQCPNGCSRNGICGKDGVCECCSGFFGSDCSRKACPDDCGSLSGRGERFCTNLFSPPRV